MVVLDGLDEIPAALLPVAIEALDTAVGSEHPLIVTCRGDEYGAAVVRSGMILTRAAVLEVEPVNLDDAASFLTALEPSAKERWGPIVDHLRLHPDVPLARVLASPLMVSLARTVYATPTSDPAELLDAARFPNQGAVEHHLLEAFIPAAYRDAPSHPETPLIPAQGQYQSEQARRWLTFLARQMNTVPTRDGSGWPCAVTSHGD